METENNTQAAIDAGRQLAGAETKTLELTRSFHDGAPVVSLGIIKADEKIVVLTEAMNEVDARAERPLARRGVAVLTDVDSFIAHGNRFKDAHSAVFADRAGVKLQAVYDYHDEKARWGKHRAAYACPLSRQWKLWLGGNEKPFGQEEFGTFIDDNMGDLAAPDAGDFPAPTKVLDMARNLVVRSKGTFERKLNPTTGEATLVSKDEHEPESTKIFRAFLIGIQVFEGGTAYRVEARLRFSLASGRPQFSYSLYQHERVMEDAFGEVCDKVRKGTELPLFYGQPE